MSMKAIELSGLALDWAVQMAVWVDGGHVRDDNKDALSEGAISVAKDKKYSTNWMHGGPLIERFIGAASGSTPARKYSIACTKGSTDPVRGDSILIASCRAIVHSKLGEVVDVPSELMVAP